MTGHDGVCAGLCPGMTGYDRVWLTWAYSGLLGLTRAMTNYKQTTTIITTTRNRIAITITVANDNMAATLEHAEF